MLAKSKSCIRILQRLIFYFVFMSCLMVTTAQNVDIQNSINVTGQGVVYVEPDVAIINLSIITKGYPTPEEAVQEADDTIARVKKALSRIDIDAKNVKTNVFSIYPQNNYNSGKSVSDDVSYTVNYNLTITIQEVDKVNAVILQSINAGANTAHNVQYSLSNYESIQEEARALAVASVHKKAQQLADLTNVKLGEMLRVEETSGYSGGTIGGITGPTGPVGPVLVGAVPVVTPTANSAGVPATPMSNGQIEMAVSIYLSVVYAIE